MQDVQRAGKVLAIGCSNFEPSQIELLTSVGPAPAANQIEYHPFVPAAALDVARWCEARGIAIVGHSSIGSSKFKGNRSSVNAAVAAVAAAHRRSAVQVLLRWAMSHNVTVIPGATSREHIEENLAACAPSFQMSREQLDSLANTRKPRSWQVAG